MTTQARPWVSGRLLWLRASWQPAAARWPELISPQADLGRLDLKQPQALVLPDGAAYQQIMDVFEHERRPLRARDLCLAPDLPIMPKHVEDTRAKLKRLVGLRFLDENEPRLLAQSSPQAPTAASGRCWKPACPAGSPPNTCVP